MVGGVLSRLWTDCCTVSVREAVKDGDGVTVFREKRIHEGLPCRLSYLRSAGGCAEGGLDGAAAKARQTVKLILPRDADVPPGSRVRVKREDQLLDYCASGQPRIFSAHREIMLENFEQWV